MKKRLIIRPSSVFAITSIICCIVIMGIFAYSHGEMIERYFFYDVSDTGMDFFNSVAHMRWKEIYDDYQTLYPPLANMFYRIIFIMIPLDLTKPWDEHYDSVLVNRTDITLRTTPADLRLHQASLLAFIIITILCVLFITALVCYCIKEKPYWLKLCLVLTSILSFPILYAIERGNIILLSWCFALSFIILYDHSNQVYREIGLICLAFSAGIKIYPALLGIILLWKKRFKDAIRAIIYGLICVFLPLFLMHDSVSDLVSWVRLLSIRESVTSSWEYYVSFDIVFFNINKALTFYGISIPKIVWSISGYGLCILLLISSFKSKEKWKQYFYIVLSMLLIFPQNVYGHCFFLIPLLLVFKDDDSFRKDNVIIIICMMLFTINLPVFYKSNVEIFNRSFIYGIVLRLMIIFCLWDGLRPLLTKRNSKVVKG